jgi:hypothetical protein
VDPPDAGGVIAEADGRRVDYTLGALVDRILDEVVPLTLGSAG